MTRILIALVIVAPLMAQPDYFRHSFSMGMGAGLPRADLQPSFSDSVGLGLSYGYRFNRYFQADTGLDVIFGAARIRDYVGEFPPLRIRDFQYLVPFGGRAILPFGNDRVQVYGGGGGAYARYAEHLKQPNEYVHYACPECMSRGGWGYYGLAGASLALDYNRRFRLGFATKMYRVNTSGDAFGSLPAISTFDRWLNLYGSFSVSF